MNPIKSLQERVILLSGIPKNLAAVNRAAVHLTGFGKVCVLLFTLYGLVSYLNFHVREDLVSWKSKTSRKQHALATFATIDGSKRALQASSIKTMYGEFGILEPSPSMWKFLDPSSSSSTRHIPLMASSSGKEAQDCSVPVNTGPVLVAMEKRIKEIETALGDSRQSWKASLKTIEEDVRQLKEPYGGHLDNSDANECCNTAKAASRDTTCGGPRISQGTDDYLIHLLSIIIEELKRRATR
jgi:hypothetical protein